MRQRVLKVICSIALGISVFFCFPVVASADEVAIEPYVDDLGKFDGAMTFNAAQPQIITEATASGTTNLYKGSDTVLLLGRLTMELEAGHTYNGYVDVLATYTSSVSASSNLTYLRCAPNSYFTSGTGWYSFIPYTVDTVSGTDQSLQFDMRFYFTDFVCSQTANYSFPIYANFNTYCVTPSDFTAVTIQFRKGDWSVSSDLYDILSSEDGGSVQYQITEQTVVMEGIAHEQMQQQQDIANAQESAAQQRQEQLVGGFSDDGYNDNVSGANDEVNSYLDAEANLTSNQMDKVNSYIDNNFDTGLVANYAPAIASVSTWYSQIWGSFGNLSVVFVVVLASGLAAMIIGIKGRGSG